MVKKYYGYPERPKSKTAFETYHRDDVMRDAAREHAKKYLVEMLIADGMSRQDAEREAEKRVDGDCGCPRR